MFQILDIASYTEVIIKVTHICYMYSVIFNTNAGICDEHHSRCSFSQVFSMRLSCLLLSACIYSNVTCLHCQNPFVWKNSTKYFKPGYSHPDWSENDINPPWCLFREYPFRPVNTLRSSMSSVINRPFE